MTVPCCAQYYEDRYVGVLEGEEVLWKGNQRLLDFNIDKSNIDVNVRGLGGGFFGFLVCVDTFQIPFFCSESTFWVSGFGEGEAGCPFLQMAHQKTFSGYSLPWGGSIQKQTR